MVESVNTMGEVWEAEVSLRVTKVVVVVVESVVGVGGNEDARGEEENEGLEDQGVGDE